MKRAGAALVLWILAVGVPSADMPAPVLVLPGSPEKTITSQSLRGPGKTDVLQESEQGGATTYRGMPLLEVLEKNGLDVGGMPSQRKIASAVVVAQGRDGYTVVFSIGELLLHRSDPKVFLVAETAEGPLSGIRDRSG
jgi:hypothetical protein